MCYGVQKVYFTGVLAMAKVRGAKNPMPKTGKSPTGIFSSKARAAPSSPRKLGAKAPKTRSGPQKQDGAKGPHMDILRYAHSGGGEDPKV